MDRTVRDRAGRFKGKMPTQSSVALEELCRTYWYILYSYVRRRGHSAEDAQDLTQQFFRLQPAP